MVVDLKHFKEETFPLEKILMSLAVILNYFNCKNPSLTCISLSTDPHSMAFLSETPIYCRINVNGSILVPFVHSMSMSYP